MNKLELDNHANQLNPNNENYQGTVNMVVSTIFEIIILEILNRNKN